MPRKHCAVAADDCLLCKRLAPKGVKCKRHGGPGLSTSNRGRGPKKDQALAAPARGPLAERIAQLKADVERGREAEAELAAVRELLA